MVGLRDIVRARRYVELQMHLWCKEKCSGLPLGTIFSGSDGAVDGFDVLTRFLDGNTIHKLNHTHNKPVPSGPQCGHVVKYITTLFYGN